MNKADKIIYNVADYDSKEDMIDAVLKQMKVFIETGKVFSFNAMTNAKGKYALQFGPLDFVDGGYWPVWLDMEEIYHISAYANQIEYAKAKKLVETFDDEEDNFEVVVDGDKKTDA